MPRRDLDDGDYVIVAAMSARGFRQSDVAKRLGVAHDTWARIRDRDPRALEAFEAGRAELHEELISKLLEKARDGNVPCLLFSLKILFGYRENSPVEVEHTHNVRIELPAALPADRYEPPKLVPAVETEVAGG